MSILIGYYISEGTFGLILKEQCVGCVLQPTEAPPVYQVCRRAMAAEVKTQMAISRASCCKSSVGHLEQSQCLEYVCMWDMSGEEREKAAATGVSNATWLSTWRQLSWPLAANGDNGANSANNGNTADKANTVYLGGKPEGGRYIHNDAVSRDGVISCNGRMRAVQSGGRDPASGTRSQMHVMMSTKRRRSSDYNTNRGSTTSFSAQVEITPLYLYMDNKGLML